MGDKRKRSHNGGDDNVEGTEVKRLKHSDKDKQRKWEKKQKKRSREEEHDGIESGGTKIQNANIEPLGDEIVKKLEKRAKKYKEGKRTKRESEQKKETIGKEKSKEEEEENLEKNEE